ncbi:MAG: hypothetical protein SH821_02235 [Phototrophicales bacterium]|nr:hypothetical protein [Phototrophicales bacterium]
MTKIHPQMRLYLLVLLTFTLSAVLILYPLLFFSGQKMAGYDAFNYNWNFWWIRHGLSTSNLDVYFSNFVFYPVMNNFGYHALTAVWFPVWLIFEPLLGTLGAVNIILWIGCTLNGFVTFAWLRSEKVTLFWALIGGLVIQFSPLIRYFYYNTHLNLMNWFWLPLHLLMWRWLVSAIENRQFSRGLFLIILQGVGIWGLGLSDLQFPIFTAFVLVPYGLLTLYRSEKRLWIVGAGIGVVAIGLALLWFAGPLPYMLQFTGTLPDQVVTDRPGIPFPRGFLHPDEVWWYWNVPTVGGFVFIGILITLIFARQKTPKVNFSRHSDYPNAGKWFWLMVAIPPFLFSLGADITLFGVTIPMPYRVLFDITNGQLRMPWRLAPIFLLAGMAFMGIAWSAWRPSHKRVYPLMAMLLIGILAIDTRLFATAPLDDVFYPYEFYETMGAEPYDYVVVEVPMSVGTGEVIFDDAYAVQLQYYGMTHQKRMINGFISRAPLESFYGYNVDDPLFSWLGQRRGLNPELAEAQLRRIITEYPVGYMVIHQDRIDIGRYHPTLQEIFGFLNSHPDLACPIFLEYDAVVYRTTWHPDGCPARIPPMDDTGAYVVDIGASSDPFYIGSGFHNPESVAGISVRWTGAKPQTELHVDLPPVAYTMELVAQAFMADMPTEIFLNGQSLGVYTVPMATLLPILVDIPANMVGDGKNLTITFAHDSATSPAELGMNDDARPLALMIDRVRFIPTQND